MFTVVSNFYRGEGFAWVIEDLLHSERWKYNIHKDTVDKEEAEALAAKLNGESK